MPELPDVELYRRYLDAHALDQPIAHVRVREPRVLADISPRTLERRLRGRSFISTRRHGKNLFAAVAPGDDWLLLHFGMTGRLAYFDPSAAEPAHTSVRFEFEAGPTLAHVDQRKLGKIGIAADTDGYIAAHRLGPDAMDIDRGHLATLAISRHGTAKAWLMDQRTMAGIGNVYADEILFRARLAPTTPVAQLGQPALQRLHDALGEVLHTAIEAEADPGRMPADWLLPRRQGGAICPRCGTPLERRTINGRTTWSCPVCQRR